jgi:oligosaccharide repeat unit polymerase
MLTIMVDAIPNIMPWQHGTTYLALLTAPIPSRIWPNKFWSAPAIFTQHIWPDRFVFAVSSTLPPGLIGEMYMNFGPLFVLLGMLIFGTLFGYFYTIAQTRKTDPRYIILYGLLIAMLPQYIRGDFFTPTILFIIYALPTIVALKFALKISRFDKVMSWET